jgi:hypothetical protein
MPKRVNIKTHRAQKLRYNARSRLHAFNNGGRWNEKDILRALLHTIPDSVLSKKIGRSIQAIQAVRAREAAKGGIYV